MKKKKFKLEQLNLFDRPKSEMDLIWEAVSSLRESHNSVRKRLFHELDELRQSLIETKAQNAKLAAILNDYSQYDLVAEVLEA
jgi:ribosomal 50S subunit-associated protein YjgA (DUF615 family)